MKPLFCLLAVLASLPAAAQTGSQSQAKMKALYEAHQSDFDYLLGDWEFTAEDQEHGKYGGRWSAVRLEGGQILDEYRVLGEKGETYYVSTTVRSYNVHADRWELIGMETGGGLQDFGTAQRAGSEMHIEQKFGVAGGKVTTLRIRYYNIEPDRFSWSADRSQDGGQTWAKNYTHIEARRIGPSRSIGRLTPSK